MGIKKKYWPVSLLAIAVISQAEAITTEERIKQLENQLRELQLFVERQAKPGRNPPQTITTIKTGKGDTTFHYGGFIKADAMWNDYSDGERANAGIGDEILVPSVIPVGGEEGSARFDSHIKTSRFWFKTKTGTTKGEIKTHFELDFLTAAGDERISNSANARVRHAYLTWDYSDRASWLMGQSWSTLMNTGALPEAVDFIGPTSGVIFNRQTQIRWTRKLANKGSLQIALENPSTGFVDAGSGVDGNNFDDNRWPDLIVKYTGVSGHLDYSIAAVGRQVCYDEENRDKSEAGLGLSLSGKYIFANGDDIKFQLNHGNFGRYLALQSFRDAGVRSDGSIDLIEQTGGYIAYRHHWNPKLRSTFLYAMSMADNPSSIADTNNESVRNYSVNVFYSPVSKLSFGIEYLQAERKLESGDKGDLSRLQLTSKFLF